jgi:hypothetical protein
LILYFRDIIKAMDRKRKHTPPSPPVIFSDSTPIGPSPKVNWADVIFPSPAKKDRSDTTNAAHLPPQ